MNLHFLAFKYLKKQKNKSEHYLNFFFKVSVFLLLLMFCSCHQTNNDLQSPFPGTSLRNPQKIEIGKNGGRLVIGLINDPPSFDILHTEYTSIEQVLRCIFEPIVDVDPYTGRIVNGLAENIDISDDGKRYTITLKKGIKFNDGHILDADDVLFSFYLIMDDNSDTYLKNSLLIPGESIKYGNYLKTSIHKVDNLTVYIELVTPYGLFLHNLQNLIVLPEHVYKSVYMENPQNLFALWKKEADLGKLVGTGPFKISEYANNSHLLLIRNDYYYQYDKKGNKLPYLDEILFIIRKDYSSLYTEFLQNNLDLLKITPDIMDSLLPYTQTKMDKDFSISLLSAGPSDHSSFLVFNQNPQSQSEKKLRLFSEKKFRQAIASALNREEIIKKSMNGIAYIHDSPLTNKSLYYKSVAHNLYDINRSKKLLNDLALNDIDNDGFLNFPDGENIKLTIETFEENKRNKLTLQVIIENLKSIGIIAEEKLVSMPELVYKLTDSGEWDLILSYMFRETDPFLEKNKWLSNGPLHFWHANQETPQTEWEAEIDQIVYKLQVINDFEKRQWELKRFQEIIQEQMPIIFLYTDAEIFAVRNRVGNLIPSSRVNGIFSNKILTHLYIY